MTNHMKEIVRILGVELGEEFIARRTYMIGDCHKTKEECEEDVASERRLRDMVKVKECRE